MSVWSSSTGTNDTLLEPIAPLPPLTPIDHITIDTDVASISAIPLLFGHIIATITCTCFLITVWQRAALHHTLYYALLGQTVIDLIFTCFQVISGMIGLAHNGLYTGDCQVSGFFCLFVLSGSVFSFCLVAWSRRVAVIEARSGQRSSILNGRWIILRQFGVALLSVIFTAVAVAIGGLEIAPSGRYCWISYEDDITTSGIVLLWVLCLIFISACYLSVYRHVVEVRKLVTLRNDAVQRRVNAEGTLAFRMVMIIVIFVIAYIPGMVQSSACSLKISWCSSGVLDVMTEVCACVLIIVNPWIYMYMDTKLRHEVRQQWLGCRRTLFGSTHHSIHVLSIRDVPYATAAHAATAAAAGITANALIGTGHSSYQIKLNPQMRPAWHVSHGGVSDGTGVPTPPRAPRGDPPAHYQRYLSEADGGGVPSAPITSDDITGGVSSSPLRDGTAMRTYTPAAGIGTGVSNPLSPLASPITNGVTSGMPPPRSRMSSSEVSKPLRSSHNTPNNITGLLTSPIPANNNIVGKTALLPSPVSSGNGFISTMQLPQAIILPPPAIIPNNSSIATTDVPATTTTIMTASSTPLLGVTHPTAATVATTTGRSIVSKPPLIKHPHSVSDDDEDDCKPPPTDNYVTAAISMDDLNKVATTATFASSAALAPTAFTQSPPSTISGIGTPSQLELPISPPRHVTMISSSTTTPPLPHLSSVAPLPISNTIALPSLPTGVTVARINLINPSVVTQLGVPPPVMSTRSTRNVEHEQSMFSFSHTDAFMSM